MKLFLRKDRAFIFNQKATMLEALIAGVFMAVVSFSVFQAYGNGGSMLKSCAHSLEAVNSAQVVADRLMMLADSDQWKNKVSFNYGTYSGPAELNPSFLHNEETDKAMCALPSGFFKDELGGKMTYTVSRKALSSSVNSTGTKRFEKGVLIINILLSWKEGGVDKQNKMSVFSAYYSSAEDVILTP